MPFQVPGGRLQLAAGSARAAARRRILRADPRLAVLLMLDALEPRQMLAGAATQLILTVPPSQTAVGSPMFPAIQVTVADATGATVTTDTSTVILSLTENPFGGSLTVGGTPTLTTSVRAVNGVATFSNISFTAVGQYQIAVNDGSLLGVVSTTFSVSASPAKLAFSQPPSDITAGTPFSPSIAIFVQDANGNLVPTDRSAVTLSIAGGPSGGTLTGVTTINAVDGVATFNGVSLTKPGQYTLQVKDGTLTLATSGLFTVSAGAASQLVYRVGPVNTPFGGTLPAVIVDVTDSAGNIVTSDDSAVTLTVNTGPGSIEGTATVNAVNGEATFTDLAFTQIGNYTLLASDSSLTPSISNLFAMVGPPAKLAFGRAPAQTTVGTIMTPPLMILVEDANGNLVADDSSPVTLVIGTGPGALSGTTTVAAVNGVASFNDLSFSQMGTYTLTASDGVLNGATSSSFIINGTAAQLAFIRQPVDTAANSVIVPPIIVAVEDSAGNVVVNDTSIVTVSLGTGPGVLSGTNQVTAVNGTASFANLKLSLAGTYTLVASDGGLTVATSSSFIVLPAASQLTFLTEPTSFSAGSIMFPGVQVEVLDSLGHVATLNTSSVTLTMVSGPRNGSISGTTTVAAVNGVATFSNLTGTVPGTYRFLAIDGGLGTALSNFFIVTVAAYQLQWAAQPEVAVFAGQTLNNITAWVEDQNKHVLPNHSVVTLAISSGPTGGAIVGNTTANSVNGLVQFSGISFTKTGTYILTVTEGALIAAKSKKFDVVAANTTSQLVVTSPTAVIAGKSFSGLVVKVEDQFGNTLVNNSSTITLAIQSGPGGALLGTKSVKAKNGIAIFNNLSINLAGSYVLTAIDNALVNFVTSFALTVSPVSTVINAPAHAASYTSGRAFTLTAQLKGLVNSSLAWTGAVTLVDAANHTVATGTLSAGGKVTLAVSGQTVGTYNVHVVYAGDTNHLGGASPAINLIVGPGTTTHVTASSRKFVTGNTVNLSVLVSANNGSATPRTGTVTLMEGSTVVATMSLDGSSRAVFPVTPTTGTHTYAVVYDGDGSFRGSMSVLIKVTVEPAGSNIVATPSPSTTIVAGTTLDLNLVVHAAAGVLLVPTGTVQLKDNGTIIGTLTLSGSSSGLFALTPAAGIHHYALNYLGDVNFNPSLTAVTVTVSNV